MGPPIPYGKGVPILWCNAALQSQKVVTAYFLALLCTMQQYYDPGLYTPCPLWVDYLECTITFLYDYILVSKGYKLYVFHERLLPRWCIIISLPSICQMRDLGHFLQVKCHHQC